MWFTVYFREFEHELRRRVSSNYSALTFSSEFCLLCKSGLINYIDKAKCRHLKNW
jgi:hypothetical protein